MGYKIFISYSSNDLNQVNKLKSTLKSIEDVEVYVADHSLKAGQVIPTTLKGKITESDLFILMWSGMAKSSEWVKHEIGIATGCDKPIIPILLEADIDLPEYISQLKYLKFYDPKSNDIAQLKDQIENNSKAKLRNRNTTNIILGLILVWVFASN